MTVETSLGSRNKSQERLDFWMLYITPPTTSLSEPRLLSKIQLSKLMLHPSSNGMFNNMTLNSARRKQLPPPLLLQLKKVLVEKSTKPKLKPLLILQLRADTSVLLSREDKETDSLIVMLLINLLQVDSTLVLLQDQVNQAVLMVTFWRAKNLSSTLRKWKRRRNELPIEYSQTDAFFTKKVFFALL